MFDLHLPAGRGEVAPRGHAGPERRGGLSRLEDCCLLALDEIDYGVVLLDDKLQLLHLNYAARAELDQPHPLQLSGRELRARCARDAWTLHDALQGAARRGMRRLIMLGDLGQRVPLAVVPLSQPGRTTVQLSMGKRRTELSVQCFARGCALTPAETRVLEALSEGVLPAQIAARHGVGMATVRTQISSIRGKTCSDSIGALVRQVAALPPLMGVLREAGAGQLLAA